MYYCFKNCQKVIDLDSSTEEEVEQTYDPEPVLANGIVLRPYQREFYDQCIEAIREGRGMLNADQMGLGKTLQALAVSI